MKFRRKDSKDGQLFDLVIDDSDDSDGMTEAALIKSRSNKKKFFAKYDLDFIPESILTVDLRDQGIDPTKHTRSTTNWSKNYLKKRSKGNTKGGKKEEDLVGAVGAEFRRIFKTQHSSSRRGSLSKFPQNIARTLIKFYCPKDGIIYDPFCVTGDTLISLPEGDFPIKDLVGKECYVYCSDGKEIKLRKAFNIRKTRENTKVIRVHIWNGGHIDATPEHLFMTTSGEWIEAKNLKHRQSLMPFYRNIQHGRWVVKLTNGKFKRQAKFVLEEINNIKISDREVNVHHRDLNRLNDSIENLELLPISDHGRVHHPKGKAPYIPTEQSRENLSKALSGIRNPFYGKKHSDETKKTIGEKAKGRNAGFPMPIERIEKAVKTKKRTDHIPWIQKLLLQGELSRSKIAEIVGVHPTTVDRIASNKNKYNHRVRYIEDIDTPQDVYNMEVEEFNNFAANGIIIHNCGHCSRMEASYACKRHYVGIDVCHEFMESNREVKDLLLEGNKSSLQENPATITLIEGSSDRVDLPGGYADFTITSPPYWKIEKYGPEEDQLGNNKTYESFLRSLNKHIIENHRILKNNAYCIWCVNDFVFDGIYYPYHADLIPLFKLAGFRLHYIYIIDFVQNIQKVFTQRIDEWKTFPKRHEYAMVFQKSNSDKRDIIYEDWDSLEEQ